MLDYWSSTVPGSLESKNLSKLAGSFRSIYNVLHGSYIPKIRLSLLREDICKMLFHLSPSLWHLQAALDAMGYWRALQRLPCLQRMRDSEPAAQQGFGRTRRLRVCAFWDAAVTGRREAAKTAQQPLFSTFMSPGTCLQGTSGLFTTVESSHK